MSALEQIRQMQDQGMPEDQIVQTLQNQGTPYREISEALSQNKIKAAVEEPVSNEPQQTQPKTVTPPMQDQQPQSPPQVQPPIQTYPPQQAQAPQPPQQPQEMPVPLPETQNQGAQEMQQSIMQSSEVPPQQEYAEEQMPEYDYSEGGGYEDYQPYAGGSGAISSDTITEISEQVVSEKFSDIRKHLEKVIEFKTTMETKIDSLDERLKRIEKVMDTLQSSVLRKVGDYVTNVSDIKKELIMTQKSLSKIIPGMKSRSPSTHTTHKKSSKKKTSKKK